MEEEKPGITEQPVVNAAPVPEPPKKSRWWKWVKRIFWTITVFILTILLSAGCILYFFSDKIKQYAIAQLNTYLNTPVFVDSKNIDFTVLQNFPNASVDFKDVKAMEVTDKKNKDVLLHAGKISFQFNIMDIFHENYNIKKVEVSDVDLKLKADKSGKDNFHFLKGSSDTSSAKFEFALQELEFNNVHLSYLDRKNNSDIVFTVKNAGLSGKFSSDKYSLSTEGKIFVDHYKSDSVDYLPQKNVALDLVLDVDNNNSSYTFSKGGFKVDRKSTR